MYPSGCDSLRPFTSRPTRSPLFVSASYRRLEGGFRMSEVGQLRFDTGGNDQLLLPAQCSISVSCYETQEIQQAVIAAMKQILYALATVGMDLRALDGMTMSHDCRADATALQQIPEGQIPLEISDQPDTMEIGSNSCGVA
jgi:hypothetical protein